MTHKKIIGKKAASRPGKAMDVISPDNFPRIGATLSTYRPSTTGRDPTTIPGSITAADRKARRHHRLKKFFKWLAIIIVVVAVICGAWVGWKFYRNVSKLHGGFFGLFSHHQLKGESSGRVNILLAGYSADDPGHGGAQLTDSIMIVSIDTKDNTAFMLSVPRDLYVKYGTNSCSAGNRGKINAVYECGQEENFNESGYPSGGMGLLEKVVGEDFGLSFDYYALIDYTAIKDAVNAVGGITVTINSPDGELNDPSIDYATGGPLVDHLMNGVHTLNGEQALDLARARGDAYGSIGFEQSDYQRTADQRLMLVALKSKALTAGTLANPIKLGELFDSFGSNVQTDFQTSDMQELYSISKKLSNNNIKSIGLNSVNGEPLVASETVSGQSVQIPAAGVYDYSDIQAYIQQLTTTPKTTSSTNSE